MPANPVDYIASAYLGLSLIGIAILVWVGLVRGTNPRRRRGER